MKSKRLQQFRQEAHGLLGKAKDATFELIDAALLTRSVYSLFGGSSNLAEAQ